jgi:hypothetical protein
MTEPTQHAETVLAEIRERLANIPPDQWFWDHFTAEDMWLVLQHFDGIAQSSAPKQPQTPEEWVEWGRWDNEQSDGRDDA